MIFPHNYSLLEDSTLFEDSKEFQSKKSEVNCSTEQCAAGMVRLVSYIFLEA